MYSVNNNSPGCAARKNEVNRTTFICHLRGASCAVLGLSCLLTSSAHGSCIQLTDPNLRNLDEQLIVDPAAVLERAPAESSDTQEQTHAANLQALLSEAYYQLERDQEARAAAKHGLEALGGQSDAALKVRLRVAQALPADTAEEIVSAIADLRDVLESLPRPSRLHACTLIATSHLQQAANRLDLSVADAISAYREADVGGWAEPKALAAELLGWVYADSGDTDEAGVMLDEAFRYAQSRGATLWMSVLRFGRGRLMVREHDWGHAVEELRDAISLSASIRDTSGVALARSALCNTLVELGKYHDANAICATAERELSTTNRTDLIKDMLATRAKLHRVGGEPAEALRIMNAVLNQTGTDVPPRDLGKYYLERSKTHEALGDFAHAYQDLLAYVLATQDLGDSDRGRSIIVMRTRLETDRALERARELQRQNELQKIQLQAQHERIVLSAMLAALGFAVASLLAYSARLRTMHTRELGKKEAELRTLVLNTPDWLVLLNPDLSVRFNNRTADAVLRSTPIGAPWLDILQSEQAERVRLDLLRVLAVREEIAFDCNLHGMEGRDAIYNCTAVPVVQDAVVVGLVLRCTDVTERRRREELSRTQAMVFEMMHDGVLLIQEDGAIRLANAAFRRMMGGGAPERMASSVADFGMPERAHVPATKSDDARSSLDFLCRRDDGSDFQAHAEFSEVSANDENLVICIIQDISDRKRLEAQLIEVGNREQVRIASDLHDGVGQQLTGVSLLLRSLADQSQLDGDLRSVLNEAIGHVNSAIDSTRTIAQGLAPLQLDGGGLCAALRHLGDRVQKLHHLEVQVLCDPEHVPVASEFALHLYRIAQEALANVIKHAKATRVIITLSSDAKQTVLSVRDDGIGTSAQGSVPLNSMGLQLMKYRAGLIGGILQLCGDREIGTEVLCTISH